MNPPSAIQGAMSRDRKPFTYTPGGLDLSEIKSERMAKRLMRNAMNQGVPEAPTHIVQSPPMPSTPVALPNFNCLPVQVFPIFNLPANPKTLLRTRSNPDPKDSPIRVFPPTFVNKSENNDAFNKNTPTYSQINNNRPVSMFEYNTEPSNAYTPPRVNYGSDGYTAPVLPEISYDAKYFRVPPKIYTDTEGEKVPKLETSVEKENIPDKGNTETKIDFTIDPIVVSLTNAIVAPTPDVMKPADQTVSTDNKQREVKVVKKQENNVEEHNGDQNGDANVEAELTVKLPTKKSAAKTETKVEVVKKTLPDGSIEEVKTTITKTTIDGRTEIRTKTETTIIPKEEEEVEEVEEEGEENGQVIVQEVEDERDEEEVIKEPKKTVGATSPKENGDDNIIKTEERSETTTTTTKKVVVVEDSPKEEVEEEEEAEEEAVEPVTVVVKKQEKTEETKPEDDSVEAEEEAEEDEIVEEIQEGEKVKVKEVPISVELEEGDEEEVEEEEEVEVKKEVEKAPSPKEEDDEEVQEEEEEYEEAEEKEVTEKEETEVKEIKQPEDTKKVESTEEIQEEIEVEETKEIPVATSEKEVQGKEELTQTKPETAETEPEIKEKISESVPRPETKIPIREPSIPLEKVEDVEIKPIGLGPGLITKSHTENTEIITSSIDPRGGLSTQTEYNKVENIVTVNRTTKILDHNYENITQQGVPTVKTYFPPPSIDRISTSPLPSRPYQPVYPPEPTTERRHSLLLERLSVERQIPVDTYQYSNQTQEQQTQWQDDPRAEVLTVSNVKPSSITNQQWYQQSKNPNTIYNTVPSSAPTPPSWNQPTPQPQPQTQYQPQPQYQPPSQTQYQPSPIPQTQYQPSPISKPQYQPPPLPETQYQPSSTPTYQPQPQQQYQPPYTETTERAPTKTYSYTPKPTWVSNVESLPSLSQQNQYSYNKDTTENYQKTTQQYSSSYVPPPWEQDNSYVTDNSTQNYYQPPPQTTFPPTPTQSWKPPPAVKYTKPAPISYIPPPPNKSFVKTATNAEPPKPLPGRKTYYSEYERRYITVPESTYVPSETKFQPQPDPSPQYYYDNNEPNEQVEPQWRKELREFTEKTSYTQTEQTNVQPPWEVDPKYAKNTPTSYTPTPTWSQTLRPRSWRERSFESEYVGSQEWPKTNTLGRGRPLSSFSKGVEATIPERPRGVSVDRYNPNSYQSPSEHPPVQTHTLTTPAPHASYHNPNVPAYHARASAEPREQPVSYQQRVWREARASPIQSRSFKYLQWITGTDD